ncbi:LpqB family beta-propeller domain-containing protein [Streptomyces sp. NPDC092296]|uniref:LpqB family beta-propeller domain-containing protein n=1 Tax=Streptomyces sp. NPDC092296 TaxID=3366012 RepID=UPI0038267DC5
MPRRTDRRLLAAALPLTLLLAGCAAMPDSGDVSEVSAAERGDDQNLQVRVFPVHPLKGLDPQELLQNFLDATIGDEAGYDTAKEYLTKEEAAQWRPEAGVSVLADNPRVRAGSIGKTQARVTVEGTRVAVLDSNKTFKPSDSAFHAAFSFEKENGEWRISQLPDGLIVNQTNFRNVYERVNRYFYAAADPSRPSARPPALVPDPIYLRRRIDPLTAAAKALAAGPSRWLAPAVTSAFNGVTVLSRQVGPDDAGVVQVRVSARGLSSRQEDCRRMAVQLLRTFKDQSGNGVEQVDVSGPDGGGCQISGQEAGPFANQDMLGEIYYQDFDSGRLLMLGVDEVSGTPVAGPLGEASPQQPRAGAIAVRRDATLAAEVTLDGRELREVGLSQGAKAGPVLVSSAGPKPQQALSLPSWDGNGDLWVADRDPAAPSVKMVRGDRAYPVYVEGLEGRTVQGLKLSSDGTRVALLLADPAGVRTVAMGLVRHSGTETAPQAAITGLQPVAPQLVDVTAVSWADTDQLVVLGKEAEGVKHPQLVGVDGSRDEDTTLQAIDGMTRVAAAEDPHAPVYADSQDHKIYRLELNGQWRAVARNAIAPVYPG